MYSAPFCFVSQACLLNYVGPRKNPPVLILYKVLSLVFKFEFS